MQISKKISVSCLGKKFVCFVFNLFRVGLSGFLATEKLKKSTDAANRSVSFTQTEEVLRLVFPAF